MFIEKLILENFKSHRNREINFKKYTILIGPNSSGKTSILQALLILKSTLEKKPHAGLVTRTDSYDFGEFKDIVSFGKISETLSIHVIGKKLVSTDSGKARTTFGYRFAFGDLGPREVYMGITLGNEFEISYDWKVNEQIKAKVRNLDNPNEKLELNNTSIDGVHPRIGISGNDEISQWFNQLFLNGEFTYHLLNEFHYIPFYRTAKKYGAPLARRDQNLFRNRADELPEAVMSNLSKDLGLLDKVSMFIQKLTGKTIRPRNVDLPTSGADQGVTLDFVKNGFSNSIVNEGTGPNQVILLLSELLRSSNGSVICIDEPEIHLHPAAQSDLAKILIDIGVNESKQIIFTTHSEHMIYPFLARIASKNKDRISPKDVAIYYFKQGDDGISEVETLQINEYGQIRGGLKGFWEADLDTLAEHIGDSSD